MKTTYLLKFFKLVFILTFYTPTLTNCRTETLKIKYFVSSRKYCYIIDSVEKY